jgi:exoribonuclease R
MIEEFMLLANKKVAEFIGKQKHLFIEFTMNLMLIS